MPERGPFPEYETWTFSKEILSDAHIEGISTETILSDSYIQVTNDSTILSDSYILTVEEIAVAKANPPTLRNCIRITFNIAFNTIAKAAILTGVLVSLSE